MPWFSPAYPLLVALSLAPLPSLAQRPGSGASITGVVLSESSHQRLRNVTVRLSDSGSNMIQEFTTPDSGEFYFRGLQRSSYLLTFVADGFQNAQMSVDLNFASDRGLTVYLRLPTSESAPPAPNRTVSVHELSMPQSARDLVLSGRKRLYVDKNAAGALKDFRQALASTPNYYEAYCDLAAAYLSLGKSDDAVISYRKSIEISNDTYGDAQVGLGTLLIEKGNVEQGEKAVRRGVELNPNSWTGFYELGKLEFNRNALDQALAAAERAQKIAPNAAIIYRLLTAIHLRQQNLRAALADIDSYLRLDHDSPAGLRAAQMRTEIARKLAAQQATSLPDSKRQ